MFYVVIENNDRAHGPFATKPLAALWACDHCIDKWYVQSVKIAAGAEEYIDELQRRQSDALHMTGPCS